ncbi:hypothetical protein SLEP1_g34907 [Rubroshorea leprosula]|uniref:Zinc finger PMZ-type domain-containing protein n=1 Tax=Rubroshorea leprosula TaxID=152421 RepID=A0AAV5KLU0_9ROSI|nr:hypothetical protein SLEP1_g34907 [Rubroshorea leprosula]
MEWETIFKVKKNNEAFVVEFTDSTCTCRSWQLTGIPFPHATRVMECRQSEVVQTGWGDPEGSNQESKEFMRILWEINTENTPPAIINLARKVNGGIT